MSEWQSIETAPKDGTAFLASISWADDGEFYAVDCLRWHESWGEWVLAGVLVRDDQTKPTHWMPLPNPPVQK